MILLDTFFLCFLKNNSHFEVFKMFKAMVESSKCRFVKCLGVAQGGEFASEEFSWFCSNNGIKRQLTTLYTLRQNAMALINNRTPIELARYMLEA